jgi:hypothetical protein
MERYASIFSSRLETRTKEFVMRAINGILKVQWTVSTNRNMLNSSDKERYYIGLYRKICRPGARVTIPERW